MQYGIVGNNINNTDDADKLLMYGGLSILASTATSKSCF